MCNPHLVLESSRAQTRVIVHFHEIPYWPSEYWRSTSHVDGVERGLRAFLQYNEAFEVMCTSVLSWPSATLLTYCGERCHRAQSPFHYLRGLRPGPVFRWLRKAAQYVHFQELKSFCLRLPAHDPARAGRNTLTSVSGHHDTTISEKLGYAPAAALTE